MKLGTGKRKLCFWKIEKKKNCLGARQHKENFVRNKGTEVFLVGNSFFLGTPCWKERKNSMKLNTLLTHNPFCPSSEKMCFAGPKHNWFKYWIRPLVCPLSLCLNSFTNLLGRKDYSCFRYLLNVFLNAISSFIHLRTDLIHHIKANYKSDTYVK